jgi:hypothetical protein
MKILPLLLALMACTQKYTDYDLIRKVDFQKETYTRPVTTTEVIAQGRDELNTCFNQWLFFSNAEAEKEKAIPVMVRTLCPGRDYLVNTEMRETWWTTLVFTRSCARMETLCANQKRPGQ